jgi:hypothetical protein
MIAYPATIPTINRTLPKDNFSKQNHWFFTDTFLSVVDGVYVVYPYLRLQIYKLFAFSFNRKHFTILRVCIA